MKKIISLCSIIVITALFVTMFAACGGADNDTTTVPTTAAGGENVNPDVVEIGKLTLKVNENEAVVYNDGEEFRKLIYPKNYRVEFDYDYAKEHYDLIDLNFDGNLDAYIAVADEDGLIYFYCFLYNATTTQFDYNSHLSAFNNISVDSAEQLIYAVGYTDDGRKVISKYNWENGIPVFVEAFGADEDIPEEVEQSAGSNTIGDKPHVDDPAEEDTTASGSAGETKPLLTTEPNNQGGIVLVDPTEEQWY